MVEPDSVLRALASGADGVAVMGCHLGGCRFNDANHVAVKRMEALGDLLDTVGIGRRRLLLSFGTAHEGHEFAEILGNFLRQNPLCRQCFVLRWPVNGVNRYLSLEQAFRFEQESPYKVTDATRDKLLAMIPMETFAASCCPCKIVLNDIEGFVRERSINLDDPDDGFDLDFVPHHARERRVQFAMNNTFGFGGHNVTLVIGRYA